MKSMLVFIMTLFTGYYLGQWVAQFDTLGPNKTESVIMFTLSSILTKIIFSKGA